MTLFSPCTLGSLELPNRIVMAPMTRSRSPHGVATADQAEYYRQRASAGLIVTEGSQVSVAGGGGYPFTPGIHTDEQQRGWADVTDAVHAAGGRIFLQLWHVGRLGHPDATPVAPSAIRANADVLTADGMHPAPMPRALDIDEISGVVTEFTASAVRARDAGFDGVEIHGANGYLFDQFLQSGSNTRTDAYGGTPENRVRLLLAVAESLVDVWGAGRVGVRIAPGGTLGDVSDADPVETFGTAARALDALDLAYVHVVETSRMGGNPALDAVGGATALVRGEFTGTVVTNCGYDAASADAVLRSGGADLVSFGRPFIANPDLPERLRAGAELQRAHYSTFYGGGAEGYLDFATL
ncbi:alkene reductase [Prescottella subtropica]|uniref:alkene reductase n=1 Tax=Prescottella subtropica TaxID=2545757 RepID=UPI0014786EC7|nr:alkene reductase [Prescottella subtropica]